MQSNLPNKSQPPGGFRVLRAAHLGMCFGVRDAVHLALRHNQPFTVLGDLVHNPTILQQLRSQGVSIQHQAAQVSTPTVMITAHGASRRVLQQLQQRGLRVLQGTCPLVHHAHQILQSLVQQGYHPVIVGQHHHVEVRGMTGDLDRYDVILREQDIDGLEARERFGVVAQTTQPIDRVHRLVSLLRQRFPHAEVRFEDTVCQPTKQRQSAAGDLAAQCDVVVVVGGRRSNNTHELAQTCRRRCSRVYQVERAAELDLAWFDQVRTVGLTAGTSTPDEDIDAVEEYLYRISRMPRFLVQQRQAPKELGKNLTKRNPHES